METTLQPVWNTLILRRSGKMAKQPKGIWYYTKCTVSSSYLNFIGPCGRSIVIKSCFNINRRMDCKHKFVVGLYTSADCFPIAFDCEEELLKWFITLLKIQLFDKVSEGEELKPIYGKLKTATDVLIIKATNNLINLVNTERANLNLKREGEGFFRFFPFLKLAFRSESHEGVVRHARNVLSGPSHTRFDAGPNSCVRSC